MAKGDDDILLGAAITDPADDDTEEEPSDIRMPPDGDPRGDLDRPGFDRETSFDPTAGMPAGMSVDGGLAGLTDLAGNALGGGANRHGVGDNSPFAVDRDPLADVLGTGGSAGPSGGPDLGFRAPNSDLVSSDDDSEFDLPTEYSPPPPPLAEPPDAPTEGDRNPPEPPAPDGEEPPPEPKPEVDPQVMTDPDAAGGGGVSADEMARAIAVQGGDSTPVRGQGGHIEADAPPSRPRDLVTDGGDESFDLGTTGTMTGAPDAPVINTINPDLGVNQPPTSGGPPSGGGGGDDIGLVGSSSAATAADSMAPPAPGISPVGAGTGPSGIATIASGDDGPGEGGDDPPPDDDANVVFGGREHGAAVDEFATSFLTDAMPLAADLTGDLSGVRHDVDEPPFEQLDPAGAELLEGSLPGPDDGFDG